MYLWDTESKALAVSILRMAPGMLYSLQWAIISMRLISTSCICLSFVNPFCPLEKIILLTFFRRLFSARDTTLYKQLSNEIGRQFFIFEQSPFLGISLMEAVLKLCVREPFWWQQVMYLWRGILSKCIYLYIWLMGSRHYMQGFGSGSGTVSGSVLDPYSIGPLDPDPDP